MSETYGYKDFLAAGPWAQPPAQSKHSLKMSTTFDKLAGLKKTYATPKEIFNGFAWEVNFPSEFWGADKPPTQVEFEEAWIAFDKHFKSTTLWAGTTACLKMCFLYSFASHYSSTYLGHLAEAVRTYSLDSELAEYQIVDKTRKLIVDSFTFNTADIRDTAKKIVLMFKNLGIEIDKAEQASSPA